MKTNERAGVLCWCLKIACKMNALSFFGWIILSVLFALLQPFSLLLQRSILENLSNYITVSAGGFQDILGSIIGLGIVLLLVEIANRFNIGFIYHYNYDYYYIGLTKFIMDLWQKVDLKTFHDKKIRDYYDSVRYKVDQLCALLAEMFMMLRHFVSIVFLIVIAYQYSRLIALMTVLYFVVCQVITGLLEDKITFDFKKNSIHEGRVRYYEGCVMDSGIGKELRIFRNGKKIVEEWKKEYSEMQGQELRIARWTHFFTFVYGAGYYILILSVLGYSILSIKNGSFGIAAFWVLYEMVRGVSDVMMQFSNSRFHFKRVLKEMAYLKEFVDYVTENIQASSQHGEECHESCGGSEKTALFSAENVRFSYDSQREVLKGLHFRIYEGETIALIGANGCGKSTLVKLLTGLYPVTGGELQYKGVPYEAYPSGYISDQIGVSFQECKIIHAPLCENVAFGNLEELDNREKIVDVLERNGAKSILYKIKNNIDTWLLRDVKKDGMILSGGEQQRVIASRTFISDRPVLIFDEPSSALDPISEVQQFKEIRKKLNGKTGILISHRVGFARLADRIMVLEDGVIKEFGSHEELMELKGTYSTFYREQAALYREVENHA